MQKSLLISVLYMLSVQSLHCEDFRGQNCVDGCPEMKAGYKWAQENDAHDPYLCNGHSRDFEQGCSAYVLEAGPAPPPPKKKDNSDLGDTGDDNRGNDSGGDQNGDNPDRGADPQQ
jgi:hypothetical protein